MTRVQAGVDATRRRSIYHLLGRTVLDLKVGLIRVELKDKEP